MSRLFHKPITDVGALLFAIKFSRRKSKSLPATLSQHARTSGRYIAITPTEKLDISKLTFAVFPLRLRPVDARLIRGIISVFPNLMRLGEKLADDV